MERKLSDHAFKFIVLIIGIIIVVDIANVFVIGGPSVFSLIFKPGNTISTSEIVSSPAGNTNLPTMNASANAIQNETGELYLSFKKQRVHLVPSRQFTYLQKLHPSRPFTMSLS